MILYMVYVENLLIKIIAFFQKISKGSTFHLTHNVIDNNVIKQLF